MTSFADYGVEVSRNREIVSKTEEDAVYRDEEMSAKSRKRSYDDSYSADRGNSLSPRHSRDNEAVSSDKRETIHYRNSGSLEKERDEVISTPSSNKRPKHEGSELLDHPTATDSPERKKSSKSPSKKSRRSSSPSSSSHKKHKHKKRSRSRERHRESRKESDSKHSKREPDANSSSTSKRRSRSPREKDRRSRSSSRERRIEYEARYEARRSPERSDDFYQSKGGSSSAEKNWKFKIPKRKRERSPEEEKDESSYKPPVKKFTKISSSLKKEIDDLLRTEHHHIIKKSKSDIDGGIPHVDWCYHYLDPRLPGHITGGRMHLHHFCRVCKRTCLHLLGTYGTGARKCLACAADEMGWREDEVPSWYFHDTCEHCKNDTKRRGGGGRGGYGGNRYGGYKGGYGNRYGSGYRGGYSRY